MSVVNKIKGLLRQKKGERGGFLSAHDCHARLCVCNADLCHDLHYALL